MAPHKAILLLTVMALISQENITSPEIFLSDELVEKFKEVWNEKVPCDAPFRCDIGKPFFHLQNEPFWRLVGPEEGHNMVSEELGLYSFHKKEKWTSYALPTLRNRFKCARIDADLFEFMRDAEVRTRLETVLACYYSPHKPI